MHFRTTGVIIDQHDMAAARGAEVDLADAPLLDLSTFDGLAPDTAARLNALFFSDVSPASGFLQLNAIEAAVLADDDRMSWDFDHKLHQLAGSASQAGAALLGHTCRLYRTDPSRYSTPQNVAGLRAVLALSAEELCRQGLLDASVLPALSAGVLASQRAFIEGRDAHATLGDGRLNGSEGVATSGDSSSADELDRAHEEHADRVGGSPPALTVASAEPLLDLQAYVGLPREAITKLLTLFFFSTGPGSGAHQLDALEAGVAAGQDIHHALYQLAGSSLQAGARRLGICARTYHNDGSAHDFGADDVRVLRLMLMNTTEALRADGYLP